jgi:hypothetical protein
MKTFNDYVNLKELAAYDLGTNLLGKSNYNREGQDGYSKVMQAFAALLGKNPSGMINLLMTKAHSDPEAQQVLSSIDPQDPSLRRNVGSVARKSRRIIAKGLGDVSTQDANGGDDTVAGNIPDSYSSPTQ